MPYVYPSDVHSPRASWNLVEVLLDRGEGNCAYAIGEWDGDRRIGFRWNGTAERPIGNPQSRGLPTYTMLDPELHEAVIGMLSPDKQAMARRYLGTQLLFEGVSLNDGALMLWDLRHKPPVVVGIPCDKVRDAIGDPTISDEQCRLVADKNKDLLATVAEGKLARHEFRRTEKAQLIEVSSDELRSIAPRLDTTVLRLAAEFRHMG